MNIRGIMQFNNRPQNRRYFVQDNRSSTFFSPRDVEDYRNYKDGSGLIILTDKYFQGSD